VKDDDDRFRDFDDLFVLKKKGKEGK